MSYITNLRQQQIEYLVDGLLLEKNSVHSGIFIFVKVCSMGKKTHKSIQVDIIYLHRKCPYMWQTS